MKNSIKLILLLMMFVLTSCSTNKNPNESLENPKTASINIKLGMTYLERNDLQRSKRKLLTALEQAPSLPEAWYAMGYYLEYTGDTAGAGKYYSKAVELNPARGDVQNNYGTYLCRNGQYRLAIEHFQKAVKDPDYLSLASAYENAGLCALKIPDRELAIYNFKQALAHDSSRKVSAKELAKLTKK